VIVNKKKKTNNVLPFPAAIRAANEEEVDLAPSTSFFQIGSSRFAIHTWWESLPPAPLRLVSPVTDNTVPPSVMRVSRGLGARRKRPRI